MKLHTDEISMTSAIHVAAMQAGLSLGTSIDAEVMRVGSRSHRYAYEVHMTGDGTTCRNRVNPGSAYGSDRGFSAGYAGWGWLMAELYDLDAAAVWGSVKNPVYASKQDFHAKTAWLFDTDLDLATRKAQTIGLRKNGARQVWAIVRAQGEAQRGTPGATVVLATFGTDAR